MNNIKYYESSIKTTPIMNEINNYSSNPILKIPRENARLGITYYGKLEDLDDVECYEIIVVNQEGEPFTSTMTYLLLKIPSTNIIDGVKYARINMYKNGNVCFDRKDMVDISKVLDKLDRDIILGFCTRYKDSLEYMSHVDTSSLRNISMMLKAKHFTASQISRNLTKKNRTDDALIGSKFFAGTDPAVFSAIQMIRNMQN